MINRVIITILLMTTAATVSGEYITDKVLAGLYEAPDLSSELIKVIPSGVSFEIVKKEGDFSLIRSKNGSEGWIESRFISYTKPAAVRLQELQAEFDLLQKELKEPRSTKTNPSDIEDLQQSLSAAHNKLKKIEQQSAQLQAGLKKALAKLTTATGDLSDLMQAQSNAEKKAAGSTDDKDKGFFSNGWLLLILLVLSAIAFATVSILERKSKKSAPKGASRVSPPSHTHREGSP